MKQHHKNKRRNITTIKIYHQEKEMKFFCRFFHPSSPNYHPSKKERKSRKKSNPPDKKRSLEKLIDRIKP